MTAFGSNATRHQGYQQLPKLDTGLIDAQGNVSIPWYHWFITVWQKTGGSFSNIQTAVVVEQTPSGGLVANDALTGEMVGTVVTTGDIIIIVNDIVNNASAAAVPADQLRPQRVPGIPPDQLRLQQHYGTVMDQANMANAINHSLALVGS